MIASVNPYTSQVIKKFSPHSDKEIHEKIELADKTFYSWRETSFEQRAGLVKQLGAKLLTNKKKYAELITLEMGKLLKESEVEIEKCAKACTFYAENAAGFLADEIIQTDAQKSLIVYQPIGIVLGVMPWNFPFWQVIRYAVPTLMAGNVCLLKHASNVPQCALEIEKLFQEAGFPPGCFQTLFVESNGVLPVVENDKIKAVTLTGSEPAGSSVASVAGKLIKKSVLELGGSDPFIVLDDADLEKTVATAIKSRMINTGQSCIAAKRFIVTEKISRQFIEQVKQKILTLKAGDPMDNNNDMGPMSRADLAVQLKKQLDSSVAKGAELLCGGTHKDALFQPTLLINVKPGMPAFDEEIFGPVFCVIIAKDENEAVTLANQSRFGLGGSVWTQNRERGLAIARKVESGSVYVNTLMKSDQRMPFGGTKKSGYGRELSKEGIREFVNVKSIMIN